MLALLCAQARGNENAAGFQSIPDFDRVFKARTGITPSAFRDLRRPRASVPLGMSV